MRPVVLDVHHAIADPWSMDVLEDDMRRLLDGEQLGRVPPPFGLRLESDEAFWTPERTSAALSAWVEHWSAAPRDYLGWTRKGSGHGEAPAVQCVDVPPSCLEDLGGVAQGADMTLAEVLVAACAIALGRWAGDQAVVVDMSVFGRRSPCEMASVGPYADQATLFVPWTAGESVGDYLARVREAARLFVRFPSNRFALTVAVSRVAGRLPPNTAVRVLVHNRVRAAELECTGQAGAPALKYIVARDSSYPIAIEWSLGRDGALCTLVGSGALTGGDAVGLARAIRVVVDDLRRCTPASHLDQTTARVGERASVPAQGIAQHLAVGPARPDADEGEVRAWTEIFKEVLRSDKIGPDSSFFEHGGQCWQLALLSRVGRERGLQAPPTAFLWCIPTPRSLAGATESCTPAGTPA